MIHSYAKRGFFSVFAAGLIAGVASSASAGPAEQCRSKQIAAAGKACATILKKCYAAPAKSGLPQDAVCMGDALVSLTVALDKAEAGGMCDYTMLDLSIWDRLEELADGVATGELAYRANGACAAKKLKAAAKQCQSIAKCYSSAAKTSPVITPDAGCIGDASEKLTETFSKIEQAMTCVPAGNVDDVKTIVDGGVADISTLFTSGTTTTTLPE